MLKKRSSIQIILFYKYFFEMEKKAIQKSRFTIVQLLDINNQNLGDQHLQI